ncbi:hypothetical protein NA78x_004469 [Anatilimnocola sp. NA78]|uniref:hypothetical protein n=1 Tax=Anatilimnocola sp. NA78 TaxID=3415683 RepID=UPI003CE519AD
MSSPRLILCERTTRWLAAWRRTLPQNRWQLLRSVISLPQCESQLRESPGSVAAISVDEGNLSSAITALHRWQNDFPTARFLALCSEEIASQPEALLLLREAGVLLTIERSGQLSTAARLVLRHLRRTVAAELPLPAAIWERLPWARFAVSKQPVNH